MKCKADQEWRRGFNKVLPRRGGRGGYRNATLAVNYDGTRKLQRTVQAETSPLTPKTDE